MREKAMAMQSAAKRKIRSEIFLGEDGISNLGPLAPQADTFKMDLHRKGHKYKIHFVTNGMYGAEHSFFFFFFWSDQHY